MYLFKQKQLIFTKVSDVLEDSISSRMILNYYVSSVLSTLICLPLIAMILLLITARYTSIIKTGTPICLTSCIYYSVFMGCF